MEALKFLSKDKYIGPLIKKFGDCEIKPRPKKSYFVSLVRAITNQQLSDKAADTIFNRLQDKCKGEVSPQILKKLRTESLRKCGLSYAKCKYVKDLADRTLDGRLEIKKLDKLNDEEVMTELVAVKGIGRWTAEMFLMFSLARADIFPADDLGIKNGIKKLTGKEMKPKELARFAERWKPYRTYASWYIWAVLDKK